MSKSDDFVDSFVEWVIDSEDEGEVIIKLKSELNLAGFVPSDELVNMLNSDDILTELEEEEEEEDEDEDEVAFLDEDEDEEEDDV